MKKNNMTKIAENKYICDNQFDVGNSVVISNIWETVDDRKAVNAHDGECKAVNVLDYLTDAGNAGVDALVCSKITGLNAGDDVVEAVSQKDKYEFDYELVWLECTNEPNAKKAMSVLKNLLKEYNCVLIRRKSRVAVVVELDRRVKYAIWKQVSKAFAMWLMLQMQLACKKVDKNRNKLVNAQFVHPVMMEADFDANKIETVKAVNVKTDFVRNNGKKYVIKTDNMMKYLKQVKSKGVSKKQWQELLVGKSKTKKVNGELVETFTWDKTSEYNANLVTQNMLAGLFKYNSLTQSVESMRDVDLDARKILITKGQISSNTVTNLKMWLEFAPDQQLKISTKQALEVINAAAQREQYNPFMDYLNSLPKWDGKKRLEQLFIKSLGADDTKLNRWLPLLATIGLIYRAKNPGEPVDAVIDLTGDQRSGKTKMIQKLCNSYGSANEQSADPNWTRPNFGWYIDNFSSFGKRDDMMSFIGKLYLNDDELVASRRTNPERIKAFATENELTFRKPYDIEHTVYHRCNILWRTTNDLQLYVSKMGQQKFFPVVVHKNRIKWQVAGQNPTWTTQFVDQIWAEAVYLYTSRGEKWAHSIVVKNNDADLMRENEVAHAQLQYVDDLTMSLVGYIADKFSQGKNSETMYISTRQIKDDLDLKVDMSDTKLSRKIAAIMTNDLGFEHHLVTYNGRRNLAGYASTAKSRDAIALSCRAYHIDVDSADAFVTSDVDNLNSEIESSLA